MIELQTAIRDHRPARPGDDRRRLGPAWHKQVAGLHVLKVKGDFREMGRQHGALLRDAVAAGPVPYFRDYVQHLMGRSLGKASPLVWTALQRGVGRRVARGMPDFVEETLRGLADGSGLSYQELLDGCTMPDTLMWLAARLMRLKNVGPAVHHRLALGLGCTSAIAWGGATRDGRLLHARNFDYHGVGNWPYHAAVIFHEPERGQRYVSFSSAGIPLGGATAMNEAGLSLTVHQHMFTDRTRLGGVPIGVVGDVVMREARNLDDAERILGQHRPIGCWTYLVTDGHRRQVLCWEENPDRRVARRTAPGETTFGYANIYLDAELGATEQDLYGSYWRHNLGRHQRANALLAERAGALDAEGMAGILAHRGDPRCRIRDSISFVMTVGSVVFRPEDGALWVSTGEAPVSRNPFVGFRLGAEDHAPELGELRPEDGERPAEREAFQCFRRAYVAYVDRFDPAGARAEMERARALCPEQPLYHVLAGFCAMQSGDAPGAEEAFGRAIGLGHPDPERMAGFHLWRARCRDLQGRRQDALADYRATLGHHADPPVRKAARRGLDRAYTAARARRVNVDFAFADVVGP